MIKLFAQLKAPNTEGTYSVTRIPDHDRYRLGKDNLGRPSLLISPSADSKTRLTIEAKHINVGFGQLCDIDLNEDSIRERITIARCLGTDPFLHHYFLSVCESIIITIGQDPSDNEIEHGFKSLLELFAKLNQASTKTAMGLWSELLLIANSSDITCVSKAWQKTGKEVFDFNLNDLRIEVKSTGADARVHNFRLPQLSPPGNVKVLIASMHAVEAAGGTPILELVEEIKSRLTTNPSDRSEFEFKLAQIMGSHFEALLRKSFDRELAQKSIMLFDAKDVPKIKESAVPPGVSSISFKSDLSGVPIYSPSATTQRSTLLSAMGICLNQ